MSFTAVTVTQNSCPKSCFGLPLLRAARITSRSKVGRPWSARASVTAHLEYIDMDFDPPRLESGKRNLIEREPAVGMEAPGPDRALRAHVSITSEVTTGSRKRDMALEELRLGVA